MVDINSLFSCITQAHFGGGNITSWNPVSCAGTTEYNKTNFPNIYNRYPVVCGNGVLGVFYFNYRQIDGRESGEVGASSEIDVINILAERTPCGQPYLAQLAAEQKLQNELEQLALKTQMLQSETAVSSDAYFVNQETAETNKEIEAMNLRLQTSPRNLINDTILQDTILQDTILQDYGKKFVIFLILLVILYMIFG